MNQRAWMLHWILQELKKYARKTCDCSQPQGHLSRVLNGEERLWRWNFVSSVVCDSQISLKQCQRQCSWPSISCALPAAVLSNGLEHLHPKARLCAYLLILRSDAFGVWHSRHQSLGQKLFRDRQELKWCNELILETVRLLDLLNSR